MNVAKADLVALRWPLAGLVLSLAVAIVTVAAGLHFIDQAQRQSKIASAQKSESQSKLSQVAAEEQELRDKIGRFNALRDKGYIGTENRLDWIELIGKLSAKHKLHDFGYEFLPQRQIEPLLLPGPNTVGGFRFLTSTQTFTARLLHEGDLVAFLDDLQSLAPAMIVMRSCEITRILSPQNERGPQPNLDASCRLEWVTLQAPK